MMGEVPAVAHADTPAAVTDWGANGIVTCLGHLLDRQLLHEPSAERRMLVEGAMAGAVDGTGGGTTAGATGCRRT